MGGNVIVPVVLVVLAGVASWALWRQFSGKEEGEQELHGESRSYGSISYSNPNNNHDHNKVKHSTRRAAEREVERMKWRGLPGSDRLNVYYNEELKGWFVGRGWGEW